VGRGKRLQNEPSPAPGKKKVERARGDSSGPRERENYREGEGGSGKKLGDPKGGEPSFERQKGAGRAYSLNSVEECVLADEVGAGG